MCENAASPALIRAVTLAIPRHVNRFEGGLRFQTGNPGLSVRTPHFDSFRGVIDRRLWHLAAALDDQRFNNKSDPATRQAEMSGPNFEKAELLPVIAQDDESGDVLMLAYMNEEAWQETIQSGRVCYYSRSRQKLWRKGEESGNVQEVKSIFYDCDADTLLIRVNQIGGAACHEGYRSCFFRKLDPASGDVEVIGERVFDPNQVYGKS